MDELIMISNETCCSSQEKESGNYPSDLQDKLH